MAITGVKLAVGSGASVARGATITKGAFSLTFDRPVLYRETADGLHLVHANGAKVTAYAPAATTMADGLGASRDVNQFAPNTPMHIPSAGQGHDGRVLGKYNAARRATLPWTPLPGDSVMLEDAAPLLTLYAPDAIQRVRSGVANGWHGVQFTAALPDTPTPRLLAGTLAHWTNKVAASYDIDIEAKLASLPAYALTGAAGVDYPSAATIIGRLDKFFGPGNFSTVDGSGEGYEAFVPQGTSNTGAGNTYLTNYGRYLGAVTGAAALHLVGNHATIAEKRVLLKRFIQIGCQIFEGCRGVAKYDNDQRVKGGYAGHFQWELAPICAYLWARGLSAELDALHTTYASCILAQPFVYDAAMIAGLAPHADASKPFVARRRLVTAVSGNDVTVQGFPADDQPHLNARALRMVRESDGANAVIVDELVTLVSAGPKFTVAAQPSPAFAVNDVIYFQAQHTPVVGDVDWMISPYGAPGVASIAAINPGAHASYRSTNFWLDDICFLKALGVWRSVWDKSAAYVVQAMQSGYPAAGDQDWPTHADAVLGFNMALNFWTAHKTALGLA